MVALPLTQLMFSLQRTQQSLSTNNRDNSKNVRRHDLESPSCTFGRVCFLVAVALFGGAWLCSGVQGGLWLRSCV